MAIEPFLRADCRSVAGAVDSQLDELSRQAEAVLSTPSRRTAAAGALQARQTVGDLLECPGSGPARSLPVSS